MKLILENFRKFVNEEGIASIAGEDIPQEDLYPGILGKIISVLNAAYGEDNYNLYKTLKGLAEFHARSRISGNEDSDPQIDDDSFPEMELEEGLFSQSMAVQGEIDKYVLNLFRVLEALRPVDRKEIIDSIINELQAIANEDSLPQIGDDPRNQSPL